MGLMIPIACEGPFPDVASLAALVRRYAEELQTEAWVVARVETRSRRLVVQAIRAASSWDISFSTRRASPRMARALASYGAGLRAEYLDAHHAEGCLRLWKRVYQLDGLRVPLAGRENQSYQDHARETRYSARHPVAGFVAEHWRRLAVGRLFVRVSGAVAPRGFGASQAAAEDPARRARPPEEAPRETGSVPPPEAAGAPAGQADKEAARGASSPETEPETQSDTAPGHAAKGEGLSLAEAEPEAQEGTAPAPGPQTHRPFADSRARRQARPGAGQRAEQARARRGLGALLRLAEKEGRGFSLEVTLPVEAAARLASRWRAPWRWDLYDLVIEVKERSAVVYRVAGV